MALDRNKVLAAAQKHLSKGNYDKAIAEYRRLVEEDPKDVRTWLKIGDLYTRKGARKEATETYGKVAEHYASQGFFLKAVAVYKQILKLDPTRLDVCLRLGEMYEQLQLTSDALTTYEQVAAAYARNGDVDKSLATLAKMTELDPENIPVRIKYAEALSKATRTADAAKEFQRGAELLKAQGRLDDYMKVAERLLFHRPDDAALARELSAMYLERQDAKRALAKLQICFKTNPRDVDTLDLLAQAFHQLGQTPKTVSVYKEVARIHQEANRLDARAKVLAKILELDPGDAEARQALAGYAPSNRRDRSQLEDMPPGAVVESQRAPRSSQPAEAAEKYARPAPASEPPETIVEEDDDAEELDPDSGEILIVDEEEPMEAEAYDAAQSMPAPAPASPSSAPGASPSVPPEVALEAKVARLLTECEVYARYGLKTKIIEQLEHAVDIAPHHVEARERLKDAYIDAGRSDDAADQLRALAEIFTESRPQLAQIYLRQILEIDPENPFARSNLRASMAPSAASSAPPPARRSRPDATEPSAPDEVAEAAPAQHEADDDVLFLDDGEAVSSDEHAVAQPSETTSVGPDPEMEAGAATAHDEIPGEPSTSEVAIPLVRSVRPGRAVAEEGAPDAGPSGLAPMSPEEFEAVPLRAAPEDDAPAAESDAEPGEIEEILDEAEFYMAQGLWEEARETLEDALASHPKHPLILDKLEELREASEGPAPAASVRPLAPEPASDDSFALAEKLAEELDAGNEQTGSDVLDLDHVFAQFKKGVEEQIEATDSETHYDLGIAYKEMGLIDDAVNEFRLAMSNPERECIAETMIGMCHLEQGRVDEAIVHFKKGLGAPRRSAREELGLYYELGNAYELLRDANEALYYFQKVQNADPGFRGVGDRIRNLADRRGASVPASASRDEVDQAFDDLFGDE